MSVIQDIEKSINNGVLVLVVLDILLLFTPGVATIFYFNSFLFLEFEIGKLILLAAAITIPVVLGNFAYLILSMGDKHGNALSLFTIAGAFSTISFYLGLLFSYFFVSNLRMFILWVVLINVALFICLGSLNKARKKLG